MNFFGKGFPSEALVELRADLTRKEDKIHFSSTNRYFSQRSLLRPLILSPKYSRYLTSPDGTIDTSRQGPVSGTYVGTHRFFSFNNIHNAYYTQWPQIISKLKSSCWIKATSPSGGPLWSMRAESGFVNRLWPSDISKPLQYTFSIVDITRFLS